MVQEHQPFMHSTSVEYHPQKPKRKSVEYSWGIARFQGADNDSPFLIEHIMTHHTDTTQNHNDRTTAGNHVIQGNRRGFVHKPHTKDQEIHTVWVWPLTAGV